MHSASAIGVLALGQTMVRLTGGLDIGIAKTAVVAGMVGALTAGFDPVAPIVSLLATTAVELANGILISRAKVNPVVVTWVCTPSSRRWRCCSPTAAR